MALLGLIHPSEDPIDAGNLRLFLGEGQGRVMFPLGGKMYAITPVRQRFVRSLV